MNWQDLLTVVLTSGVVTAGLNFYFEKLKNDKEAARQRNHRAFEDKLAIYRMVVDLHSNFLHDLQSFYIDGQQITPEKIKDFDKMRMKSYGYLAMLAPQDVMDAHEELVERIIATLEGTQEFNWAEIREKCLVMLNAARKDIGLDTATITYNGNR